MQSPEVWTFKEPASSFHIREYQKFPLNIFEGFHFNHLVSVVIPDCLKIPENLVQQLTDDCEYYKLNQINLAQLLNPQFLTKFIKQGKFTALSIGTRIDCDNCVCVTSAGVLVLLVNKDTYQSLGLEGKPSFYFKKNKEKYIIKVDLKDGGLQPDKSYYIRVMKAFNKLEKFTLIMSWEPPKKNICPSSVAKFFQDLECSVSLSKPTFKTHVLYSINTPDIWKETIEKDDVADFVEWLGMVAIDGDFLGTYDSYINTYEAPEPHTELGQIRFLQWRGFYTPSQTAKLLSFLKKYSENAKKPWITMYVQGFSDMPYATDHHEHHYYTNGDYGNVLIFNNERFLSCLQRNSLEMYK